MTSITLNHTRVMGHGVLQVSFKYLTSLLEVSYKSLTSLLQVSYIKGSLFRGHGSWIMGHRSWIMVQGTWGMGHKIGSMGNLQDPGYSQIAFICFIASFVQKGYVRTN
jgi:hypothetical protein